MAVRQAFRDRVLTLTRDDVIGAFKRIIVPGMKSAYTVVFASKELLEKENAKLIANDLAPLPIERI